MDELTAHYHALQTREIMSSMLSIAPAHHVMMEETKGMREYHEQQQQQQQQQQPSNI
jgi:hypothetical protein